MDKKGVLALARVLKALVTLTFLCNLMILPLVPGLVGISVLEGPLALGPIEFLLGCWQYLWRIWRVEYTAVLAVFLFFCGTCTAVILWQARRVLKTIVAQNTFVMDNAKNMKRAAVCCFLISGAALARMVWGFFFYHSILPLFTYNALFAPIFVMGGLLCMVMSALFRQAAALKEDNDLTI